MAKPLGYSRWQIRLHWAVAVLIVLQVVLSDGISSAYDEVTRGMEVAPNALIASHVIGGILVLAFGIWRLVLRMRRGVPDAPATTPWMQVLAGEAVHYAIYGLLVLVPMSGMAAWFGGVAAAGDAHEVLKTVLIVLVLLHVLAALYHQFYLKDGLLLRMKRPAD